MLNRSELVRQLVAAVFVAHVVSCTTPQRQLYPGVPRPPEEIVIVREHPDAERTEVVEIDDIQVHGDAWEILPGDHRVVIEALRRAPLELSEYKEGQFFYFKAVCRTTLSLHAGGRYVARSTGGFTGQTENDGREATYRGVLAAWLEDESKPGSPPVRSDAS